MLVVANGASSNETMNTYLAEIETRIAGIPCLIGVSSFAAVKGSYSSRADTAEEYYGYAETSWDVLDTKGKPAAWLERKLTPEDHQRIEEEIFEAMTES